MCFFLEKGDVKNEKDFIILYGGIKLQSINKVK